MLGAAISHNLGGENLHFKPPKGILDFPKCELYKYLRNFQKFPLRQKFPLLKSSDGPIIVIGSATSTWKRLRIVRHTFR